MPQVVGAAGDFTAIDHYAPIFMELTELWMRENVEEEVVAPMMLLKCILENQGMKLIPHLDQHGHCIGWRAWFTRDCDYTANKNNTFDTSIGCDIPTGNEEEAVTIDYKENCYIWKAKKLSDQDCNNRLFAINQSAQRINAAIKGIRKTLAETMSTFLSANAQVNNWTGTYGFRNGTTTEFTSAEFGTLKLLYHLQLIAQKNQIDNYKIVNGTNFWELAQQAIDGKCCENEGDRTRLTRYNMEWDLWLDEQLGRQSTFLFNPSMVGFSNTPRYSNRSPELKHNLGDGGQIWGWVIDDPMLSYLRVDENGRTALAPVRYDVEYKKICVGRGTRGDFLYEHTWAVFFNGGHYVSPVSCNNGSGILEFVNVS